MRNVWERGRGEVTIFHNRKDFSTRLDKVLNEVQVEPLALSLCAENSSVGIQWVANRLEELKLEKTLRGPHGIARVDNDTVIFSSRSLVDNELGCVFEEQL
jgi:hypothetical protein